MNNFMSSMKNTLDDRKQLTENGAVGYSTTGKYLLDMNFAIGSLRNESYDSIQNRFAKAYYEDPLLALKFWGYIIDVRGGLGERRTGRACTDWLVENKPNVVKALLVLIPEYSRWDNLVRLYDSSQKTNVIEIIKNQLKDDAVGMQAGKSISQLAKWMYSVNCSNKDKKRLAKSLASELGLTEKNYRKMLSKFRAYLHIVEVDMCNREWGKINYEHVPSRANLIYNSAFLRNDTERRKKYLESLSKGEAKINSSVLFPHDIVHKYMKGYNTLGSTDEAIEAMWKGLPDYVKGNGNTLVVGDGSGSMYSRFDPNSSVMAVDVANALAIYFAEHMTGQFANQYITFGGNPHLVDFSKCNTLRDKVSLALKNSDYSNTDIAKVFRLILDTAVKNHMSQEEMPDNVLILSDGEFDTMCYFSTVSTTGRYNMYSRLRYEDSPTLFDGIAAEFASYGYRLPKLIFWNINSRTNTIPVKQNKSGVILVSGFSPAVCKMVLSNQTDPYKALLEVLNSDRYQSIEDAVQGIAL